MQILKKSFLFLVIFIMFQNFLYAQENILKQPPKNIRSVVLKPGGKNSYVPIIRLGEPIHFSFDDLDGDEKTYSYKIEHCDYNWNISDLISSEYLSGFSSDRIRDYENSFNTLQPYTHYEVSIPNTTMKILKTGNYLISVLGEEDEVVFTRRFIVYQNLVDVAVSIHRSRDVSYINQKHDVQFIINHPNINIRDPYQDIKVVVYQNMDWNSALKNVKPKYVRNSQLLYNYIDKISFWAGNEYLYFDSKEIRNATNNIQQTRLENIFNTYLYYDEEQYNKAYSYQQDINGSFVLRTIDSDDISLEGDYSKVHFSLESTKEIGDKSIYVYGAFNDWQISEENRMTFNPGTNLYEATLLLKQGFYNYTYVTADTDKNIDLTDIVGSFYQTENEYTVIVYYKSFGDRYFQVAGVGSGNSKRLGN